MSGSIDGVRAQVAAATIITRPTEIAVFWTTESTVIGPPVATGVWRPGWPGVPVPQLEGSV